MARQRLQTAPSGDVINAPWERAFDRVLTPFEEFIRSQTGGGIVLLFATATALLIANSTLVDLYEHAIHTIVTIQVGEWALKKSVHHWVNDGLMALFFFLAGLEIKREILVGELASLRRAALPVFAAIGGMLVPALVYFAINPEGPASRGWGIPMATDIAFAVGVLTLLGSRIPRSLLTFVVALAIVDDLGAVLVIALFYTDTIAAGPLAAAAGLTALLVALNLGGIRRPMPYFLIGALVWLAMLLSGIHATVAGVLVAFTIPARAKYAPERFSRCVRQLLEQFDTHNRPGGSILQNEHQHALVQTLENGIHQVETPLQRLEHGLHRPVSLVVVPLFALVNAGVPLAFDAFGQVAAHPVTLGIVLGLVGGKFAGVCAASWIALRLGAARLPEGVTFGHILGAGWLAGVGFTMSLFIAELGFAMQPGELLMAKTGILIASFTAGTIGCLWLLLVPRPAPVAATHAQQLAPAPHQP